MFVAQCHLSAYNQYRIGMKFMIYRMYCLGLPKWDMYRHHSLYFHVVKLLWSVTATQECQEIGSGCIFCFAVGMYPWKISESLNIHFCWEKLRNLLVEQIFPLFGIKQNGTLKIIELQHLIFSKFVSWFVWMVLYNG